MLLPLALLIFVAILGFAAIFAVAGFVLRAALWLVLLPFKLLFLVIGLPIALVGGVLTIVGAVLFGTLLLGAGILAAALSTVLLPVLVIGLVVWALSRLTRATA